MKILSVDDLDKIDQEYSKRLYWPDAIKVNIGMASCGIAAGAQASYINLTSHYNLIRNSLLPFYQEGICASVRYFTWNIGGDGSTLEGSINH